MKPQYAFEKRLNKYGRQFFRVFHHLLLCFLPELNGRSALERKWRPESSSRRTRPLVTNRGELANCSIWESEKIECKRDHFCAALLLRSCFTILRQWSSRCGTSREEPSQHKSHSLTLAKCGYNHNYYQCSIAYNEAVNIQNKRRQVQHATIPAATSHISHTSTRCLELVFLEDNKSKTNNWLNIDSKPVADILAVIPTTKNW